MKVKELIKELSKINPELEVVMSSDGEGNSFSPLYDFYMGAYFPDSTWSGEFSYTDENDKYLSPEEINDICMWPVN